MAFKNSEVKTLSLSSLGGMLEFYDFIIFVFFTKVISELFFPTSSAFWANMNTYGAFAAGYFARPLGGVIMAHFGDRSGRKNMFMLSILLMVIPTFALGLMPTYESIGILAPIVLILVRVMQGIAIGGELPGAWVFVKEHNQNHLGATMGIFTSAVVAGILLGSIVTLAVNVAFSAEQIKEWAWRVPFLLGGVFGIISIFLRRYLSETPVFKEIKALSQTSALPIKDALKSHRYALTHSFFTTWVLTGCVVITVLLTPNLLSEVYQIDNISKVIYQMIAICALASGNVFGGILSDRVGIGRASAVQGVGLIVFAFIFYYALTHKMHLDSTLFAYYAMAFSAGITVFTPLIMVESFPPKVRYSGISLAYNVSYAIFGGLTPPFFSWVMMSESAPNLYIGYYMMFLGALAIVLGNIKINGVRR